jgi:hypothetical protein
MVLMRCGLIASRHPDIEAFLGKFLPQMLELLVLRDGDRLKGRLVYGIRAPVQSRKRKPRPEALVRPAKWPVTPMRKRHKAMSATTTSTTIGVSRWQGAKSTTNETALKRRIEP